MANNATEKKSAPRKSRAAEKAKGLLKDARSRYTKKMKDIREEKTPNALMNVGLGMVGALPTAIVCGVVPDSYKAKMAGKEYEVPTGTIVEGAATVLGTIGTIGSAVMGWEGGIHAAGGVTTMGAGFLVRRGTRWGVDAAWKAWQGNGNGEAAGVPGVGQGQALAA